MTSPRFMNKHAWLFLGFVLLLSYLTYFHRYWYPQAVFWDENYHIAAAQKELNGVYFMEQHPPLGKLLIAAGEKILHPNLKNDQYITTDYASNFPEDFSFAGYRFFSALLAWWTAPLLFFCFLLITRKALWAAFLSFFYIFDNALIVHLRGAMLEGPFIFFTVCVILSFLSLMHKTERSRMFVPISFLFGASFAAVMTTKLLGLVLLLLIPAVLWKLRKHWMAMLHFLLYFTSGFLVVYITVWQVHFSLGKKIVPSLPDSGYYQASSEYRDLLAAGRTSTLLGFPIMLRDSLKYVTYYNHGTPRLDLCKPDENGSPFYFWPFGGRSINYRWETPEGTNYRYLYLQSNPVVWLFTFACVCLAVCLLVASVLAPPRQPLQNRFLLTVFVALYAGFFAGVSLISRVLYLYHYFIALIFGFIIVGLVVMELRKMGKLQISEYAKSFGLMAIAGLIFVAHQFYRPLTYYEPLNDVQFQRRALLPLWELTCVKCQKVNSLAVPRGQ